MVRFSEINEDHLDVSKPFLPPKSKSLWSGFYAGTKRVFKPFAKSSQSSQVAETPSVEGTARIQDSEASETSAPSEIGKPEAGQAIETVEGAGRVECSEVVEASAPLDGPPLVASEVAPESAKEEVKEIEEKVSSKALQELDGLKEAIFGLQSELQMLRRDNGALKSALCAQGGALPVEIAVSPTPSAASLLSKEKSKSKAEEDELVSAVPAVPAVPALPMPQATSSRQTERRADQGTCWQPIFEDCWEPASRQHLEDKKGSSHTELATHEPPSARVPLSPLATTVGTSTYGGATPSMPASTAASPQMARLPPPREPPMDSSRDGMPTIAGKRTAPMPDSWGRQANVGWRRLDEIDPQPNFLGRRAEEQSSSSLRPPLALKVEHPPGAEMDTASEAEDESDCPEAPPESDEECPSPPPAPTSPWIPGLEESSQALQNALPDSMREGDPKVVLPFPDVPMQPLGRR